jgi:leader peptidase (prepilin peptidase)/N-methyltransferase
VVIHRLPVMLDRQWRAQCQEFLAGTAPATAPAGDGPEDTYNLVRPRSACPACQSPIKPWHNIPVLGWLWLRGRCATCGTAISVRYPIIEALTGLLSLGLALRLGATPELVGALLLGWTLVALAVIDLDHQLLPDVITLPLMWGGILWALLGIGGGLPVFAASLEDAVIGALAGYLSLWTLFHGFRLLTGKEGMGYGDFKLFAALGAWLGWQLLPLVILLSAATGAIVGVALIALGRHGRQVPIPFGPYLAAAGLVAIVWGRDLMNAWLRASFG